MSQLDSSEMNMSIIEVDEALKDDAFFCYDSDGLPDDIASILNKWKQIEKNNLDSSSTIYGNNAKFIDTRTFTRPKKKNLEATFLNMSNEVLLEQEHPVKQTPINLKIGGLVTSMQDSFLSATTPPVLMDSSLITSNDFSNLDFLSNEFENTSHQIDNLKYDKHTHFNGYNLDDVINDRNFLDKLCNADSVIQKDDHISRTDCILNDETFSSGNNTLHSSEDFSMKSSVNTPIAVLNETFAPVIDTPPQTNLNETVVYNTVNQLENNENLDILNGTFGVPNTINLNDTYIQDLKVKDIPTPINVTFEKLEEVSLVESEVSTPDADFKTKLLNRRSLENLTPISNKMSVLIENEVGDRDNIHSTPLNTPPKTKAILEEANRTFTPNSPINLRRKAVVNNMNNTIVLDNNDLNEFDFNKIPQNLLTQAEEERRSLVNFVEFEKSIQLLETAGDRSEKEFDDLLNSLGNMENKILNEKMRQSLDNIKKRHSLLHTAGNHQSENNLTVDNLKLSDSMNKSMSSSTGSERLLNRRSRMYDDNAGSQQLPVTNVVEGNNVPNITELNENTKTQLQEKKERDRDRFKTIRITRKPSDETTNLPDADVPVEGDVSQTKELNLHTKTNASFPLENEDGKSRPPLNTNTFKKPNSLLPTKPSGLCRLRYGQKTMLAQPLKSNSEDNLLGKNRTHEENGSTGLLDNKSITKNLEFPMGEKAKSFHNIAGCDSLDPNSNIIKNKSSIKPVSKLSYPRQSGLAQPMEKIDSKLNVNLRSNLSGLRKPATTTRPSSAYYSYHNNTNNKKNDYDHEISSSGGCSSNSLSSSASSRGSSQQFDIKRPNTLNDMIDLPSNERTTSTENVANETVLITSNPQQPPISKLSGIRPPSNLRPPTARSGLPRPTGIPRR